MRPILRKLLNRSVAGYLLAAILLLLLFLYLRFPGEAVTDYLRAVVAAGSSQVSLSLDKVRPSFPPGLAMNNVTLTFRDPPEGTLRVDHLSLRPGGLSLLRGRLALLLAMEGYGGKLQGRIDFTRLFSLQGPLTAAANFQGIRVEKCVWLREVMARQITGELKGMIVYSRTAEVPGNGSGRLEFTLDKGSYPLREALFGFDKLDFSRIEGKIGFRNGALQITQLTLTGEKFRLSLNGNILPAERWPDARIDLNGTVELPGQNNKKVRMAIEGTLGNAKMRFL